MVYCYEVSWGCSGLSNMFVVWFEQCVIFVTFLNHTLAPSCLLMFWVHLLTLSRIFCAMHWTMNPTPVCRKCIYEKLSDEEMDCCPVCNIDLGCLPVEKLRSVANLILQFVRFITSLNWTEQTCSCNFWLEIN